MDRIKVLIELINKLYHDKFFGDVLVKFESGVPTIARKTESIKL